MADPLSPATRATKRNLLLASVLAISANAFNVSIDKIPMAGLSITFDDRLFAFLLLVVLSYFLCTFALYYLIDINNSEATDHQTRSENHYKSRITTLFRRYGQLVQQDLSTIAPEGYYLSVESDMVGGMQFEKLGNFTLTQRAQVPNHRIVQLQRKEHEELFQKIEARQLYWIKRYQRVKTLHKAIGVANIVMVRFMYLARNYFFDGFLPFALGVFALVAILCHLNLAWIQNYLPSFKALSSKTMFPNSD